jgi:rhamnosyltransferase
MSSIVDLVVVTYFPDRIRLKEGLVSLSSQVRNLILVSNNSDDFSDLNLQVIHVDLQENRGIGYAQNIGIQKAIQLGSRYVLTSDQDTVYPRGYVNSLLEVINDLHKAKKKIGAIGPVFRDENNQGKIHPMVKFGKFTLTKFFLKENVFAVSHMISSGMLIPVESFQVVGLMREEFFMDWIDTEWCWRSTNLGYEVFQVPGIVVSHTLGNSSRDYFIFSKTNHSYPREYFKIRNAIFLIQDPNFAYFPNRIYLLLFLMKNLILNLFKGFNDKTYFKVILSSLSDGYNRKSGPCPF